MIFKLGSTTINYNFDNGNAYIVSRNIINITGEPDVIVITDILFDEDYSKIDIDKVMVVFKTLNRGNATIAMKLTKDSYNRLCSIGCMSDLFKIGFIGINALCEYAPESDMAFVLAEGKGRDVADFNAAIMYMEATNYSLLSICRLHVDTISKGISLDKNRDELVTELHDALEKTISEFNEKYCGHN